MKKRAWAALALFIWGVPANAESPLTPLNPAGWSGLDAAAAAVGYWINGARLCDIDYDPVALELRTQQFAELHGVSVTAVKREAPKWADRFAPNVTRDTCRSATEQAKRLGILSGYKPPSQFPAQTESLVE